MDSGTSVEPVSGVPVPAEKQSTESDSPSSVNMDSEHADAVGTPMIVGESDSGKDVSSFTEEKEGDGKVNVTVSTQVVQNGSADVEGDESASPLRPLAKRIRAIPEKIIR